MRPNDLYSWYCVLHSATSILEQAAKIHIRKTSCPWSQSPISRKRRRLDDDDLRQSQHSDPAGPSKTTPDFQRGDTTQPPNHRTPDFEAANEAQILMQASSEQQSSKTQIHLDNGLQTMKRYDTPASVSRNNNREEKHVAASTSAPTPVEIVSPVKKGHNVQSVLEDTSAPPHTSDSPERKSLHDPGTSEPLERTNPHLLEESVSVAPALRVSKVPSSRIGRMFHYGGLAASLGYGAASEMLRRSSSANDSDLPPSPSLLMTEANLNRLVSKLSQMRGAALKLGQFMSIQDSHVLPEELERVLRRVQDSAHYMPNWQMEKVMTSSLGPSWRSHFNSFTPIPSHAASIGQVHTGIIAPASSPTGKEEEVAIKIQFPRVAESISSDLSYMKLLLGASALLPKGLFLDNTIKVFETELADECDYRREASYILKFRAMDSIMSDSRYRVPWVWDGSTEHVLVMERMKGVSVGGDIVKTLSQTDRNEIASRIIELCLRELFEFQMMQTDPNWTNFLWNAQNRQVELIDFGATREYSREFIEDWLRLLAAAVNKDSDSCLEWSRKLGYLIGGENEVMVNAHLTSMQLLGTPFRDTTPQPFSFARGSAWTDITQEIRAQIPIMLNNRLTPPPRETYSLNRKLSGAFLLAGRLGASVDCRSVWERVVGRILASL